MRILFNNDLEVEFCVEFVHLGLIVRILTLFQRRRPIRWYRNLGEHRIYYIKNNNHRTISLDLSLLNEEIRIQVQGNPDYDFDHLIIVEEAIA